MATATPPDKNPVVYVLLGLGAFWFLTQRRAVAAVPTGGVTSPAYGAYAATPYRAGATAQQIQTGQTINAVSGFLGTIMNSKWLGGSGSTGASSGSLVNEQARAAVRAGDPYYGGAGANVSAGYPAPTLTTGDFARMDRGYVDDVVIDTAAARAAVRYGDPYYTSGDTSMVNPIASSGQAYYSDYGYASDAVALNPAPGSSYSTDVYDIPSFSFA